MKKSEFLSSAVIIFPFAFIPCVLFLDKNAQELAEPFRFLIRGIFFFVATFGISALCCALFGLDVKRISVLFAVVLFLFFQFQLFLSLFIRLHISNGELIIWTLTTIFAGIMAYHFSRSENFRLWIILTGYLFLIGYSFHYWQTRPDIGWIQDVEDLPHPPSQGIGVKRPLNIYTFILDGYPSQETLERVFHYENLEFYDKLKNLGFIISDQTYANYPVTFLSLSSMLQMDYVLTESSEKLENRAQFYRMATSSNRVLDELLPKGYAYIYGGSLETSCPDRKAALCLKKEWEGLPLGLEDVAMLKMTPFPYAVKSMGLKVGEAYLLPVSVAKQALAFKNEIGKPIFLFAHIQSPHNGERFDANCKLRGGSLHRGPNPTKEVNGRKYYVGEIECVSRQMTDAAKMIVSNDPNSIILIASDHGSAFTTDFKKDIQSWSEDQLSERYNILWAMRTPAECNIPPDGPSSLIKTFPIVLSCIEDYSAPPVKDRFFFFNYDKTFKEIFPDWISIRKNELKKGAAQDQMSKSSQSNSGNH